MLEFLKNLFSLSPASPTKKRAGFFEINVEEEEAKLSLVIRGKRDGAREVPASEEQRPGVLEKQIIEIGSNLIRANTQHYEQEFHSYNSRLAVLTPQGMLNDAQLQSQSFFADIEALPTKHSTELRARKERVIEKQKQLKLFQHDNGLDERAAHYPKSKILHFSVIVVILLIESALNATLLAKGNELGLLGGWTEAIIISLINVGALGWLLCMSIRWCISRKLFIKLGGVLTLFFAVSGAIGFNLAIAHYRNALGGEFPALASTLAYQSLLANPLGLGDVKSLMLFILGISVVCLAAFDWLKMDDWYPGYGRLTRAHLDALGEHASYQSWLVHEKLQSLKDGASDVISRHMSLAASAASEDAKICAHMKKLNERYRDSVDNIQTGVNSMLQIYREANKASRDTEAPAPFEIEWKYPNTIDIQQPPGSREMPDTQVFLDTLHPLQTELSKKYQRALKVINETTL